MLACDKCRHWKSGDKIGECRRFPPVPFAGNKGAFALTSRDDWCGEFRHKEVCAKCSSELSSEQFYNPQLKTALAQSIEGRICKTCYESSLP